MSLTRRELLAGAAQLAAAAAVQPADGLLPATRDFAIPSGQTYLNNAFIHPIPVVAAQAVSRYIETRTFSRERWSGDELAAKVRAQFARLINAKPAEISLVESTSRGENLVVTPECAWPLGVHEQDAATVCRMFYNLTPEQRARVLARRK